MAGEDDRAKKPVQGEHLGPPGVPEILARSRDYFITVLDYFPNPIWRSGTDGKRDYFNRNWLACTGRTIEQELGDGWVEGVHPEDFDRCIQTYRDAFQARRSFEIEYRLRNRDGEYRWILDFGTPFCDLAGDFAGYIGSCYDIDDRKRNAQQLAYVAMHDHLTGLPNRRSLQETLERVVARARRGDQSVLLFLDLDNFKQVNDWFGHVSGDVVLVGVSNLLRAQLRTEDLLARVGGDKFAVLLQGTGLEEARLVADRMRQAIIEHPFDVDGVAFDLSLSIGMATIDGTLGPDQILAEAGDVMHMAKEQGRRASEPSR